MSINDRENRESSKSKGEPLAAYSESGITPERIQYHIAEGHRLRAELMNKLIRKAFAGAARACQRIGQAVTGQAQNRSLSSLGD